MFGANDPISHVDPNGLKDCYIHYWVGHSSSIREKLQDYKNDKCSRHAVFACRADRYVNDILDPETVVGPVPWLPMGGRVGPTAWEEWARTFDWFNTEEQQHGSLTWVEFQVMFARTQIRSMRNTAAELSLDHGFVCSCECDDIKIVVHRVWGFRYVPDEVKALIRDIEVYPWTYRVPDRVKNGCCPGQEVGE